MSGWSSLRSIEAAQVMRSNSKHLMTPLAAAVQLIWRWYACYNCRNGVKLCKTKKSNIIKQYARAIEASLELMNRFVTFIC